MQTVIESEEKQNNSAGTCSGFHLLKGRGTRGRSGRYQGGPPKPS